MNKKKKSLKTSHKLNKKTRKTHQFVCTGNTCRSAALQAIARSIYPELRFESCGTAIRYGKKGEPMTPAMARTLKKNKLEKAYLESKKHKSRSCTCGNISKVSNSNGIMFVVADKNIKELKDIIKKCQAKNKSFKTPKIQKLTNSDIFDGYDDSCELWERKNIKCDTKKKDKERKSYQKSFNQIIKGLKKNKTLKIKNNMKSKKK